MRWLISLLCAPVCRSFFRKTHPVWGVRAFDEEQQRAWLIGDKASGDRATHRLNWPEHFRYRTAGSSTSFCQDADATIVMVQRQGREGLLRVGQRIKRSCASLVLLPFDFMATWISLYNSENVLQFISVFPKYISLQVRAVTRNLLLRCEGKHATALEAKFT